jgi:hypothetical protein
MYQLFGSSHYNLSGTMTIDAFSETFSILGWKWIAASNFPVIT